MNELEEFLKTTQTKIDNLSKKISKDVVTLQNLVNQQVLNYNIIKEQYGSKTYHVASVLMGETANDIKTKHQCYSNLRNRKVIDKTFCEHLGIIHKPMPNKKNIKRKSKPASTVMSVANMNSKLRQLNETDNLSDNERDIMRHLLTKMAEEL